MRVKSAKTAGGELDHLRLRHLLEIRRRADDVVGDQMRHVAGDGEHQIVMRRAHELDARAHAFPEFLQARHSRRIDAIGRRQDAPALMEDASQSPHPGRIARCRRPGGRG